jgi:multiple sugar transport system permease protein
MTAQAPFLRRPGTQLTLRYIVAIAITIFFIFPVYWLFIISFKTPEEIFAFPPVWYPKSIQFANYGALFKGGDAVTVWNSLVLAGTSTVIAMVFGWVDSYHGLIILYTAFSLPYVIWMMRGYIEDLPLELEESALVDGCTRWEVLWKVVFPMVRSGLFATAVFTFVFAWNDFLFALVLTRTEVITYTVQVTHYFGGQSNFWAKIAAMSVLGTIPVFFTVATLQRYLVRGISMGAVKG